MQNKKYSEAGNNKASEQDEKDLQALIKARDVEKSSGRFSPVGKAQANVFQAQRIKALIEQYKKDPNSMPLTGPASLSEVAIGLNSLLSATGGSEESRKSLIPQSARGKFTTLEQYLTNRPVGAEMAEFVKNAQDTLNRETQTNQKQVDDYKAELKRVYGLGRYASRHPDKFDYIFDFKRPGSSPTEEVPTGSSSKQKGRSINDIDADLEKMYKEYPDMRPR